MKNIHKAKFILIGLIIGLIASSFFAYADEIGQFILTKVNYPIIVNNQEYTNSELPALNYEGNTYVPLKAVGKLLNAEVKWNDELKRVEIGDNSLSQSNISQTSQVATELNIGETYDNGNIKITLLNLNKIQYTEPPNYAPDITEHVNYDVKIELDENTILNGILFTTTYITDNPKYNTPPAQFTYSTTGRIDFGNTETIPNRFGNTEKYKLKKISISVPSLNIENIIWTIGE